MAYLSVLTPVALVSSDAIAVTFANNVLGQGAWIIPVMVAISAFGGLSVHIMTSSRMLYVGARNGHFPAMLSHLNVNKLTPMPSLVFLVSLITPSPEPMLFIIFLEHSVSLHASYE
jgi:L-type amino acid transporter 5